MKTINQNTNVAGNKQKSKTELLQAIVNLNRQNARGQYDERIVLYRNELQKYKSVRPISHSSSSEPTEITAIMLFNKDSRFTITE